MVRRIIAAVASAAVMATGGLAAEAGPAPDADTEQVRTDYGDEPYRPQIHYTPEENWMNDPNGMVFHEGVYHLYYQHNPDGDRWGNMSWGHATSTDLMHWVEQPLAIPQTVNEEGVSIEDIFSGSVVVDHGNTSGFGTEEDPPLVALYTSAYTGAHPELAGIQAQSLAYSTDGGYTWTKYEGNPVLDRNSANFRDPKVFWYDGGPDGESYWVMVVVEATEHRVLLYRSEDLKDWTYLSDFGPTGAVGGIWECPDLFELPVDGDPENTKWVMVVNLNPGSVAGGSGGQYFVGDFDGSTFTADDVPEGVQIPEGDLLADFEGGGWGEWTVANEIGHPEQGPFGPAPVAGTVPGQQQVTGYAGEALLNSFVGHDWPVGSAESPPFTLERDYLSMLLGGGHHPHVPGGQLENEPPPGALRWDGFELPDGQTLADVGWQGTGDLAATDSPSTSGGEYYLGEKRLNTWEGGPHGDGNVGTLTSPPFTLDGDHVSMLVGGGRRAGDSEVLQVQLLVGGQVVRHLTGPESGALNWRSWDVAELRGQQAQLRVVDEATGGWGHLTLDHVVVGDEPARVRSDETTVNLVLDGEVVRSATGANSEHLDWVSWDVAELRGQQARLRVVDNNRGGWGHVLLDQAMATDAPQPPGIERHRWLDWGRDYYATVSFSNVPHGRRIMLGWMNDWAYANEIPTSPWRSSMALPREVTLTDVDGRVELRQQVVTEVEELAQTNERTRLRNVAVDGTVPLAASGQVLQVDVTVDLGEADRAGLTVLASEDFVPGAEAGEGTLVAYDRRTGRLQVDRSRSGAVDFAPAFPGTSSVPVPAPDGRVRLQLYLDRSSVEVLTADGRRTVTSQVFPDATSDQITLFSEGGPATFRSVDITPLDPSMHLGSDVTATTSTECERGSAVVATTLRNEGDERVRVLATAPVGDVGGALAPGQERQLLLPVDEPHVRAGTVTVRSTGTQTGQETRAMVPYPARDCG